MRTIDLRLMNHLPMLGVVGDDGDWRTPGEPDGKGTPKFFLDLASPDALLLPTTLLDQARRSSYCTDPGVPSIDGVVMNTGEVLRMIVEGWEE